MVSSAPIEVMEDAMVGEFIFNYSWEISAVEHWITPEEAKAIKRVQFPLRSRPDEISWALNADGCYSVKSGYRTTKMLDEDNSMQNPSSSFTIPSVLWKKIWALKIPNKIKHFLWRVCSCALPTKE